MSLNIIFILFNSLHFLALAVVFSALFFTRILASSTYAQHFSLSTRGYLHAGNITVLVSAIFVLAAQVGLMGNGWPDIIEPNVWLAVLGTSFGQAWQWQILLAIISCVFLGPLTDKHNYILLALITGQLAGLAFIGHALMHEGALGVALKLSQTIHLFSVSYWVGGLVMLLKVMKDSTKEGMREDALLCIIRFSRYGHLAVALVICSGLANTIFIRGWSMHGFSPYTQLLTVKIMLVFIMVMLALINRYWLVPRFKISGRNALKKFIRLTYSEIVLSLLIICLVSVFSTLNPF
ncbi:copper homeostasis membrane protein CopD [Serratia sp. UGAL515B_01]|uniref:copper homeostasis membrane protein CopD n=1 Tax=Serratia sp. UGAL515B_01 TaxID=2986763 RepID=UPI00295296FA|nr:copper homeostasis membrane protein CopD [Serratia sp. UGAL515B_01]WON78026.1 copper homeostasis membrane protein CopD [Serratia sp. UGAL515B_01]